MKEKIKKAIRLRKKGIHVSEIAKKVGISTATVSKYTKDVKPPSPGVGCMELAKKGYTAFGIALLKDITYRAVCDNTKGIILATFHDEDKEMVIGLRLDGYSINEVERITGIKRGRITEYTKGMKIGYYSNIKPKETKVMKKVKKKVKATPTQIEQRDMLGKGIESGIYSTAVKLREDRDEGRLVKICYMEKYGNSYKYISIRVRDNATDTEAGERFCSKFDKLFQFVC
ncbi:MAG TPA: helix-turn-helix domain-containing protein [Ureibacillus sp.]|nr:helix-turn-helix domain-containing protein [Ureibacillus sp.]